MLTVARAPRVGLHVEFDHKNQDYKYSLLLDQYRCLLMFENTNSEQITTEFRVIGIFTNQGNQAYILQDQIFHPFILSKNIVAFRVYQKDILMFFDCINGQFSENLNGKSVLINQEKELQLQPIMRNLYLNQAMTIRVTKNGGIIILVEGTMFNVNKLFVQVYSVTLNLIFQNSIEIDANDYEMQLYSMNDSWDSFIICKQCFEQKECLNFYLYQNQAIQKIDTTQNTGDLTIVDAIGYNKNDSKQQSNSIIFLCNQNPIGNPKLLICDYLGQNTTILELNFKQNSKEYATVLGILFEQNERFAIHYEMQVSVDENGDFIQVVQISEDLKSVNLIDDESRMNRENSISEYKFGKNGFIEIPRIWECYNENYYVNEYQVNSVDESKGKMEQQLKIESKLIYFNQFPDVYTFAYHFMNKSGILNNLGINVCEDVIMKLKEQNEEQM